MRRFVAVLLVFVVACPCFAGDCGSPGSGSEERAACVTVADMEAGRGCCSWHKGQCGCRDGRVVCCDGTLSPTCRCRADQPPVPGCNPVSLTGKDVQ